MRVRINAAVRLASVLFALSTAASAQLKTWVVDDDFPLPPDADFGSIQAAVSAASEFDLVLVRPGQYQPFSIAGKSLTVQGEGDPVVLPPSLNAVPSMSVSGLAPEQSVSVRGLHLSNGLAFLGASPAVTLSGNQGAILLEDCVIESVAGTACVVQGSASVVFHRSSVESAGTRYDDFLGVYLAGAGLDVAASNVDLVDTLVQGGRGADAFSGPFGIFIPNGFGDPGLRFSGSSHALTIAGSEVRGGDGGSNDPALCLAGEPGGHALDLVGAGAVRLLDTLLAPGVGGQGLVACATDGADGLPVSPAGFPVRSVPGDARSFAMAPTALGGTVAAATWSGAPGDFVFLLFSNLPQGTTWFEPLSAALYLPQSSLLVSAGTLGPTGAGSWDLPVGPFGPVFEYAPVFAQAVFLPATGGLYSSGPSRSVWLSQLVHAP